MAEVPGCVVFLKKRYPRFLGTSKNFDSLEYQSFHTISHHLNILYIHINEKPCNFLSMHTL